MMERLCFFVTQCSNLHMALRTSSGACQKRRRSVVIVALYVRV